MFAMNQKFGKKSAALLAVAVFGVSSLMLPASAAPVAPNDAKQEWIKQHQEQWIKQRQEHLKQHLDSMANRLEIKASQQAAWQAYAKVIESAMERPGMMGMKHDGKPELKFDAASITRRHAEMAAAMAQKLAQVADATAKLQEVLTPEQRKTLDQIVAQVARRAAHRFHGGGHGMHQEHEGHEGHEGGHWGHQQPGQQDQGSADNQEHAQH